MSMGFYSDTTAGAAPEVLAAVAEAFREAAYPYGDDRWSGPLKERFCELFETAVEVFPVATGTAANALALSVLAPPYGAVLCHRESHVLGWECGAPEFYTGGAKMLAIDGPAGKLGLEAARLALAEDRGIHRPPPAAISLTQSTDLGAVYSPEEVRELAALARRHGLAVHMDGARFANAVAALGVSPAEITWQAGVDVLSFGGTKNGALAAEAVVLFRPELAEALAYRRKRAGHLPSKHRFLAAQLLALVQDDLWLRLARHANQAAIRLAERVTALPDVELSLPAQTNLLILTLPRVAFRELEAAGYRWLHWPDPKDPEREEVRWVTSFETTEEELDRLLGAVRQAMPLVP